ncbi:MAG: single-stranded-DNA-specific exonuclease RecJ [Deltaproteobacteria bacterium]|nr:MAG: single-stranded-DNA-specific exonuclease RecJ [Deltaproteobacteria bacterium]
MRWKRHPQRSQAAEHYAREFDIHPLTAQLLLNRGVNGLEQMRTFLEPRLEDLTDPFLMRGMETAVRRIRRAIVRGERIHLHGDYDVDGLTSTSVTLLALRRLGALVDYRITQRHDASVGLSPSALKRDHLPQRPDLIITVDCGTSNLEAIDLAREQGIDVIVVDHHSPGPRLPRCAALLNPMQPQCGFPFKGLAAVGVAFTLVRGLQQFLANDDRDWPDLGVAELTDLVALGTIADVVPLVGDNRILVREGLDLLCSARRPGICALMRSAGLLSDDSTATSLRDRLNARTIGFRVAPLLNAAGRMGDASRCVDLLTTDAFRTADAIARELESINLARQQCEREIVQQATRVAETFVHPETNALVLADATWHPGVLGIVASRLADRFHMPVIVTSIDERGLAKGSVRSPETIDVLSALHGCRDLLETFGGHRVAAGVSFRAEHLETFRERFNSAVTAQLPDGTARDQLLEVDAHVRLADLSSRLLSELERLAPFGHGNPEPVFESRDVQPLAPRALGGDNLKVRFREGSQTVQAFGFGLASRGNDLRARVDILYTPRHAQSRRSRHLELVLRDIRSHHPDPDAAE